MNFEKEIKVINEFLESIFTGCSEFSTPLFESMKYSLNAGGKRIRPVLSILSYEIFRSDIERIVPVASAIEMIHTYSLIHDDLPAMDNDDFRRGRLSNHKVFGEGMAILAGDGLLTLAFEIIADTVNKYNLPAEVLTLIANKSGPSGMVGGQACDIKPGVNTIEDENKKKLLNFIQLHKTADLITASVLSGAIGAGAVKEDLDSLKTYAENIGFAFQITDDILDETGNSVKMGKSPGKDSKQNKLTHTALYGIENSMISAESHIKKALDAIGRFSEKAGGLAEIAANIIHRDY